MSLCYLLAYLLAEYNTQSAPLVDKWVMICMSLKKFHLIIHEKQ